MIGVIMLIDYLFMIGMALYYETDLCPTIGSCSFLLMRLTFFDGNGFDLVYSLSANHPFLFLVVFLYMCITAFGVLNGLVGIFGTIFAVAANDAFVTQDDDDDDEIVHGQQDGDDNENFALDVEAGRVKVIHNNNNNIHNAEGEVEAYVQKKVHFINALKSDAGTSKFALKELYRKELEKERERDLVNLDNMSSIDLELSNSKDDVTSRSAISRESAMEQSSIDDTEQKQQQQQKPNIHRKTLKAIVGKHFTGNRHRNAYIVPEVTTHRRDIDVNNINGSNDNALENSTETRHFDSTHSLSPPSSSIPSPLQSAMSFASNSSVSPSKHLHRNVGGGTGGASYSINKTKSNYMGGGMFAAVAQQAVEAKKKSQNPFKVTDDSTTLLDTRIVVLEDKINNQSIMITTLINQMEILNETLRRSQPNAFRNSLSIPIRETDEDVDDEEEESVHTIGSLHLLDSAKIQDF